mgnify:CR=1 FL=1
MSHPALTQLRALRYFKEIPALETATARLAVAGGFHDKTF